jgi:hypothetical protein
MTWAWASMPDFIEARCGLALRETRAGGSLSVPTVGVDLFGVLTYFLPDLAVAGEQAEVGLEIGGSCLDSMR